MRKISPKWYVMISVIFCAVAMSLVDGVIQPPYALKSVIKVVLFLLVPFTYFALHQKDWGQVRALFVPQKRDLLIALALGAGVYGFILGGYLLLTKLYDISELVLKLTADAGVGADNFVFVSIYISLVNSMLEEFLFRGFAFLTLKKLTNRRFAYIFSALIFAIYHFGMMAAGNIWISLLALIALFVAGCMFNWLNERSGNIITSWLVHMFANFAINTIGFMIFGII